jgi:hypothetical protein
MSNGLILFGAGASYGSQENGPPLGDSLFAALQQFGRSWGELQPYLAMLFKGDFEAGMTATAQAFPNAISIMQREMAAFFFQYQPSSANLYRRLAQRIRITGWRGAITTLNYERLLEASLLQEGLPVVCNREIPGSLELCLPHGCCHLVIDGLQAGPGISFPGMKISFEASVRVIDDPAEFMERLRSNQIPPVMSYFEPTKTTTAGRAFIESQRQRWSALAASADVIAIVGTKVRSHDAHIWQPLESARGRIIYCSGAEDGKKFKEWSLKNRAGKKDEVLSTYFAESFDALCSAVGIKT